MNSITLLARLVAAASLTFTPVAIAVTADVAPAVYKCKTESGAIEYQDFACKGGVVVDIKPDPANPAAIARLERAQAEFNRTAAEREALSLRREELNQRRRELAAAERLAQATPVAPDVGYFPAYGFDVPRAAKRPKAMSHDHADRRRHGTQGRVPAVIRRPHRG